MRLDALPNPGMSPGAIFAIILIVILGVALLALGVCKYLRTRRERGEERTVDMGNFHESPKPV